MTMGTIRQAWPFAGACRALVASRPVPPQGDPGGLR